MTERRSKLNSFAVDLPKGRIKNYEKEIIMLEEPDFLIPMHFIDLGEKERVFYDCQGMMPMTDLTSFLTVRDTFDLAEGVFSIMDRASDFLLFPERLSLRKEAVYFDPEKKRVRLVFLPPEWELNPKEELLSFLKELQSLYLTKETSEYIEILKEYVMANRGPAELWKRTSMMKREAFLCGIR